LVEISLAPSSPSLLLLRRSPSGLLSTSRAASPNPGSPAPPPPFPTPSSSTAKPTLRCRSPRSQSRRPTDAPGGPSPDLPQRGPLVLPSREPPHPRHHLHLPKRLPAGFPFRKSLMRHCGKVLCMGSPIKLIVPSQTARRTVPRSALFRNTRPRKWALEQALRSN
jgi:hypothetical protein